MRFGKENFAKVQIKIIVYFLLWCLLLGVGNTKIYENSYSLLSCSLVLALFYAGGNGGLLALIYFLAGVFSFTVPVNMAFIIFTAIILMVLQFLREYKKVNIKKIYVFILSIIIFLVYCVLHYGSGKENLALILNVALGVFFLYSCLTFLNAFVNRRNLQRLNTDEKIAGSIILLLFILGMSSVYLWKINLGLCFSILIVLLSIHVMSLNGGITISLILGISYSIAVKDPRYISLFLVVCLCGYAFRCNVKLFSAIAVMSAWIVFIIAFGVGIAIAELISIFSASVLFCAIPTFVLEQYVSTNDKSSLYSVKNMVEKGRNRIVMRLNKLSHIFGEMTQVYKDMVRGVLSDGDGCKLLKEEIINRVCANCVNYNDCFRRSGSFVDNGMDTMLSVGYQKGKVVLVDIPQSISSNCVNLNELVYLINDLISSYKDYTSAISNLDTSRVLIADQLLGVSTLLDSLSNDINVSIDFCSKLEGKIKESLSYNNIVCVECAIYQKDENNKFVQLMIVKDHYDKSVIEKTVSKILSLQMTIISCDECDREDMLIIEMSIRPNYDVAFGVAKVSKSCNKICGDTHGVVKIDDCKYMISICDGMGSGSRANQISNLTLSLIENFYKAGFKNNIILSSVNKLLSLNEDENYSTIDLCVIDCLKNTYDFIKLGATNGYIKKYSGEVDIIESCSLPVGVLDEISPNITKRLITPYDIVVLMSDGVFDVFEKHLPFEKFLRKLDIINPQTLSDRILAKALEFSGNVAEDDMTVVCVRVYQKV